MNSTLEERQNNQPQQKRPPGESAINAVNNLAQARRLIKNPLGKIGSRVVSQAGLRTLSSLLVSPAGSVLIAIAVIFIFTVIIIIIIIMGLGGGPSSETITSIIEPAQTEVVTPTPAGP